MGNIMKQNLLAAAAVFLIVYLVAGNIHAQPLPDTYWSPQQVAEILDKTRHVFLDPDLSALTASERSAVKKLITAGHIINDLYEDSMHPQALSSKRALQALSIDDQHRQALLDLYYISKGPIASTLDNRREPFLPVAAEEAGKNVYPDGMSRAKMDPVLEARPDLASGLLDLRTVVRESSAVNLKRDLTMLDQYPLLDGLHPGLRKRLKDLSSGADKVGIYALPYSVRWAPEIMKIYALINGASTDVADDDPDLAAYLALRARDLVSDNYEGGDAAWVRGSFKHLNA